MHNRLNETTPTFCFRSWQCAAMLWSALGTDFTTHYQRGGIVTPFYYLSDSPFSEGGGLSPTDYVQQQTLQGYVVAGDCRGFAPSFCSHICSHIRNH